MGRRQLIMFGLCYFNFLYGQNSGTIEYEHISHMASVNYQTTGLLEFTNARSKYTVLKPKDIIKKETINSQDNKITITYPDNNKIRPINIADLQSDFLVSYHYIFNKNNLIKETIPKIDWQIKNEYKDISKYKCQKAIGYFRGRTYVVWFASEIPVSYGPWKLQGLPGLILEAKDDKDEVFFLASKINLNISTKINLPNLEKAMPLKEFISEYLPKKFEELSSILNSKRSDRNTSVSAFVPVRSTYKEIIYEWEENN